MHKPIIAIVGRPNVGKSMLFNKLTGSRSSIVEDTPGVTRDRLYADAEWRGRSFKVVDTGGIEPRADSEILKFMRLQAEIAIENAARNRVADRLAFHRADVLTPERFMDPLGRFDLILSNPPYIRSAVVDGLSEEVRNEPRAALDGGEDGLTFYRVLISEYPKYLSESGRLIFEIGYDQAQAVTALASAAGMTCQIRKDLSGNDRVAVISR